MYRYVLTLSYEGSCFKGWQIQKNSKTVQQEVEHALSLLLSVPIKVVGSSRTDAGVHAEEFIAHFDCLIEELPPKIQFQLNGILPHQIRVKKIAPIVKTFHARYSALKKRYRYQCWVSPWVCPFYRPFVYHIPQSLNEKAIQDSLGLFLGEKDFRSFTHKSQTIDKNTVRTIYRLDLTQHNALWTFSIEGNGFLHKMVRNIIGTIIEIGREKYSFEQLYKVFETRNRINAGPCAPAQGLHLEKIWYPVEL